jgi:hypothetical protein
VTRRDRRIEEISERARGEVTSASCRLTALRVANPARAWRPLSLSAPGAAGWYAGAFPAFSQGEAGKSTIRDLHRERADPARRTVDQHPLPRLYSPLIADGSERSERGVSNRGRLLKGEVGRLG